MRSQAALSFLIYTFLLGAMQHGSAMPTRTLLAKPDTPPGHMPPANNPVTPTANDDESTYNLNLYGNPIWQFVHRRKCMASGMYTAARQGGCDVCNCWTRPSCESGTPKKINQCQWISTGPKNKDGYCCSLLPPEWSSGSASAPPDSVPPSASYSSSQGSVSSNSVPASTSSGSQGSVGSNSAPTSTSSGEHHCPTSSNSQGSVGSNSAPTSTSSGGSVGSNSAPTSTSSGSATSHSYSSSSQAPANSNSVPASTSTSMPASSSYHSSSSTPVSSNSVSHSSPVTSSSSYTPP